VLWLEARRQYAALLSLLPELLEPYQTQDASGSTQRRWAVLSDQTSVTIDAAAPAPARAAAAASSAPRAPASGGGAAASRTLDAGTAAGEGPELPRGLAQELEFLKKRHGLRVVPCGQLQGGPAGGASAAAAGAASAQLAGLRLGEQPAAVAGREQSPPSPMPAPEAPAVAAFEAELRPTDPAWDAAHPLLLRGWVAAGYPHPGSLHVSVSPRQQPPLPDLQREVLERLLAGEAAAAAGRPGALRAVLRYVENRAGQLWEQAADIAAEVARRRRQAAQQAGRASLQGAQPARQGTQLGSGSNDSGGSGSGSSSGSELDDDGAGWPAGSSGSSGSSSTSGSQHGGSEAGQSGGEGEEGGAPARGGGGGHSAAVLPLALALEGLQLEGVDAVEVLRLDLQACCARCGATRDLSFATAAVALPSDGGGGGQGAGVLAAAAECPSCHAEWRVELAPKLVHERSNVLAHVRAAGCAPRDLLPSMLAGQCGRCAASAAFRAAAVGRWNERRCSSCHELLRFQVGRVAGRGGGAGAQPQHPQKPALGSQFSLCCLRMSGCDWMAPVPFSARSAMQRCSCRNDSSVESGGPAAEPPNQGARSGGGVATTRRLPPPSTGCCKWGSRCPSAAPAGTTSEWVLLPAEVQMGASGATPVPLCRRQERVLLAAVSSPAPGLLPLTLALLAAASAPAPGLPPLTLALPACRHSYRWLRFPCCGRRFPCDLW
jgi:hypothetical protein